MPVASTECATIVVDCDGLVTINYKDGPPRIFGPTPTRSQSFLCSIQVALMLVLATGQRRITNCYIERDGITNVSRIIINISCILSHL